MYHVRLGAVPFFGDGNLFRKKLGPKKFIRDKFGYNPPVGTAHGDLVASPAVLVNESAFGRHLWFSLFAKKTSKRCKSTWQKKCRTGANLCKQMLNERTFQNCTTSVFESLPRASLPETKQNILDRLHEQICFSAKLVPKWMF